MFRSLRSNRRTICHRLGALIIWVAFACGSPVTWAADSLSIDNGLLTVHVAPQAGTFEVARHAGDAAPFVREGRLGAGGAGTVVSIADRAFGKGQAVRVERRDGSADELALYPGLPFVFFRATLTNPGKDVATVERIAPADFAVDLGKPAEALRVLGTAGLATGDTAPGSYMWLAAADPVTRAGVVAGWVSSDRGSGVLLPRVEAGRLRVRAQIDYGRLQLGPGHTEGAETLAVGFFDDARLGLEAWADAVARVCDIRLPPQPSGYCTWYHAGASDAKKLAAQTAFAAEHLKAFGFSFVQIDDGWQDGVKSNGPRKNFTRTRPDGPYPEGMKPTADMIRSHGLTAGLWLMPFAGTFDDPWFAAHQDWFVKQADGSPYAVKWGGTALDLTHPGARQYVADNIRRVTHDWGFTYLKMDGLWMGSATKIMYVNDAYKDDHLGDAIFHGPGKTNVEAFRGGLKLVREAADPGVFLLGCCAPQNMRSYGGAFGLLDAMRIGPDNGPGWASLLRGPTYGSRNYHLNGRIWWNDPDPVYVRASLPTSHARLICSWVTIAGQLAVSSDEFAKLPADRLDLLKRTMPAHGLPARPVDLFDRPLPRVWVVSDQRGPVRRDVVGLFNWDSAPAEIDEPIGRLGLDEGREYAAFDYWTNALLPPVKGRLRVTLAAAVSGEGKEAKPTNAQNACAMLAIRELLDRPQAISTSRHLTQGLVDLTDEAWDAPVSTLSGTSRVVGGDPYELRILTRSTRGSWTMAAAEISREDRAAGVTVDAKADGELVRITFKANQSRSVHWRVTVRP